MKCWQQIAKDIRLILKISWFLAWSLCAVWRQQLDVQVGCGVFLNNSGACTSLELIQLIDVLLSAQPHKATHRATLTAIPSGFRNETPMLSLEFQAWLSSQNSFFEQTQTYRLFCPLHSEVAWFFSREVSKPLFLQITLPRRIHCFSKQLYTSVHFCSFCSVTLSFELLTWLLPCRPPDSLQCTCWREMAQRNR